jgi:membrane-bound lytic murein transglycosylase MltF
MMNQFCVDEPMDTLNKGLFTFASCHAGSGRIAQLRQLAASRGLDPNILFNKVEVVVSENIDRKTVLYVTNITSTIWPAKMIEEQRAEHEKAKEARKKE